MADDLTLNSGSGGGTVRALQDAGDIYWPAGVCAFATTVSTPDVLAVVTPTTGLPVRLADGSGYLATLPVSVAATLTVTGTGGTFPVTDSGGSLTVDNGGTFAVQAAQSGTWTVQPGNTANSTAWLVTGTGGTFPVTGTFWQATQPVSIAATVTVTGTGGTFPVTDSGGSLTVDNAGTFAVQVDGAALTALQLLDNLVLAEDAAHSSGDPGLMPLAVRRDANTTLAGTDGDYAPLQVNADGSLKVAITAGAGSGGTSSSDDGAFTAGSGSGTPMMGLVTADSVDSGDVGVVGMLANRQLKVTLYDSSANELSVGGGTQYDEDAAHSTGSKVTGCGIVRKDTAASLAGTDGDYTLPIADANGALWVKHNGAVDVNSHAVTNAGTFAVQTGAERAEDAAHSTGHTGLFVLSVRADAAASTAGTDGDYAGLTTDSTGRLWCNVSNTLTVASHAVTNAGTFAVQVDGAALTALQLLDDAVYAEDVAAQAADKGVSVLAVRRDTASTMVGADNDYTNLIVDSSGRLHVNVGNTVTVAAHAVTNAGTFAVQVDGTALTALQLIDNTIVVDDAAFTPATTSVNMAGFQADESSTDSVDEGDAGAARMTLDRKQIVTPQPHTAGGLSIFRSLDLDETEEEVKGTAGCVYGGLVTNTSTGTRWLKFYNATAANVTVGTTTPVITWGIPGNATDDISAVFAAGGMGVQFDTAITVAVTTGLADNDTGAPGANDVVVTIFYK